jgi:hypothetical protein
MEITGPCSEVGAVARYLFTSAASTCQMYFLFRSRPLMRNESTLQDVSSSKANGREMHSRHEKRRKVLRSLCDECHLIDVSYAAVHELWRIG